MAECTLLNGRERILLAFSALMLCVLPAIPWHSLPGSGLVLMLNLQAWSVCALAGLFLSGLLCRRRWRGGVAGRLLLAGALLMSLPWLWTPAAFRFSALYRLAGLWALALLLCLLWQLSVRDAVRQRLYAIVVLAASIQAVLCIWQVVWPRSAGLWLGYSFAVAGGRANGLFRQANVVGSFLATGILCAVWLYCDTRRVFLRRVMCAAVILSCVALVLSESRSALFGAAAGVLILLRCAESHRQRLMIVLILLVGLLAGQGVRHLRPAMIVAPPVAAARLPVSSSLHSPMTPMSTTERLARARQASDHQRMALIKGALALIQAHPWAGNGLATFESAFPRMVLMNPFPVTVEHPHNEILYVWSEGGIVALAGLCCWLVLWLMPFRSLLCRRPGSTKKPFRRGEVARGALSLPLMVHVMTEYPFYLSALHGMLMVMLLWLALPPCATQSLRQQPVCAPWRYAACIGTVLLCLSGIVFMASGIQSAERLRLAERSGLRSFTLLHGLMNPWAQPERVQFDDAVADLMQFNVTRDWRWLTDFQRRAGDWLQRHNDANLTASMMQIAAAGHNPQQLEHWRQRGCLSFHADPRFHCAPPSLSLPRSPF